MDEGCSRCRGIRRWARRVLWGLLGLLVALPLALLALYGFLPPPATPLMLIRLIEGEPLRYEWAALEAMSPHLAPSVIAAEDNGFCQHGGFDWEAIQSAVDDYREGKRLRGASTISMQTSKNLFLWPGRTFLRKGLEAYLTVLLEALWHKRRILEVYLNVVELGPGVYGAEAAARHHFGKSARDLSRREAALLAAVLPDPRGRSAGRPSPGVRRKANTVIKRVGQIRPLLDCF